MTAYVWFTCNHKNVAFLWGFVLFEEWLRVWSYIIFYCFDCYCGIYAKINIVCNDSDPFTQISIKDVSVCQGALECYAAVLWPLWGAESLWCLSSCLNVTGRKCLCDGINNHRRPSVFGLSSDLLVTSVWIYFYKVQDWITYLLTGIWWHRTQEGYPLGQK